jgi:hypothetical protein
MCCHLQTGLELALCLTVAFSADSVRLTLTSAATKPNAAANDIQTPGIAGLLVTWIK